MFFFCRKKFFSLEIRRLDEEFFAVDLLSS